MSIITSKTSKALLAADERRLTPIRQKQVKNSSLIRVHLRSSAANNCFASARQSGSALLAVLWISAALAAIAFSVSMTVRGETERASTAGEGMRAYYLAEGGLQRAALEFLWSAQYPDKSTIPQGVAHVDLPFATGMVHVDIIPETAKIDVNWAPIDLLYRIAEASGAEPARAGEIAAAIDDWRRAGPAGSPFDLYYSSLSPSFVAPHASIQEIEELLSVKSVTPDIFYGAYVPVAPPDGGPAHLEARGGLIDCLSVFGTNQVDANTVSPTLLLALGFEPPAIQALLQQRSQRPLTPADLGAFEATYGAGPFGLRLGGNTIFTIRATARLRLPNGQLSDLRRSVGALVKYMPPGYDSPIHILRWYDMQWSN